MDGMLRYLRVRNVALFDDLSVEFFPGLTLFTGETGAGKSLLVESLALLAGGRAQEALIRTGADEALVEAAFDVTRNAPLQKRLDAGGFEAGEEVLLARRIVRGGANRAFVNHSPARAQDLAAVAELLLDLHGQSEQAFLREISFHRESLDASADNGSLLEEGAALCAEIKALEERLEALHSDEKMRAQRVDMLRYQVEEIERAGFSRGDEERLLAEERVLKNAQRFLEAAGESLRLLESDEDSALARIASAEKQMERLATLDGAFGEAHKGLAEAAARIEDAARTLRDKAEGVDLSAQRLEEVQSRLYALDRLKRKYGDSLDSVLEHFDRARTELAELTGEGGSPEKLEADLTALYRRYESWAEALSKRRRKAARALEARMKKETSRLALERAKFEISIRPLEGEGSPVRLGGVPVRCGPQGSERVEFLFSPNVGEPPKPLAKIASGGELSRVMLALKTALLDSDSPHVLIFDEVDQGIGGRAAEAVGERLKALARKHQVLCVTHLPQIAALADHHVRIEKTVEGRRTTVRAKELSTKERVEELARMLAGKDITDSARRHARQLLAPTCPP